MQTPGPYKTKFDYFLSMSKDEILTIKMTPNKSWDLDPIPPFLVCDCISILLTPITNIVNYSLQAGSSLSFLKTTYGTPLFKKGLDRNILKNYQPVSNLSYISKLIDKALAKQINKHIALESISSINKSAYRAYYSMKTALLKYKMPFLPGWTGVWVLVWSYWTCLQHFIQ